MSEIARVITAAAALVLASTAPPALGQQSAAPVTSPASEAPSLDELLKRFEAGEPERPGSVRLEARVEAGYAGREVVVTLVPEGDAKLVADPGVTVTPAARLGVDWQLPMPYRMVDTERDYFDPPAVLRLPFTSADDRPLWGEMSVADMLCHLADALRCVLGEARAPKIVPGPLAHRPLNWLLLHVLPWPKGRVRSPPEFLGRTTDDPCGEREALHVLIERFGVLGEHATWPPESPRFGRMTGRDWGILMYKHTDHHLRQFGA